MSLSLFSTSLTLAELRRLEHRAGGGGLGLPALFLWLSGVTLSVGLQGEEEKSA
jgi:hypothetical protein